MPTPTSPDQLWYKDAVFYQLHVKSFADSNGDGIGDFAGLTSRLDHLATLCVDCLWIQPMYPSPFKDDGYDISDYTNIHPSYGTLQDFQRFKPLAGAATQPVSARLGQHGLPELIRLVSLTLSGVCERPLLVPERALFELRLVHVRRDDQPFPLHQGRQMQRLAAGPGAGVPPPLTRVGIAREADGL